MELTRFGTGNVLVIECYRTCFAISDKNKYFMVDGGGGNTVLAQLKHAGFDWMDIWEIFVTHKHVDRIMGVIWMICQYMNQGNYEGDVNIYTHDEVIDILRIAANRLLQKKETGFIDD